MGGRGKDHLMGKDGCMGGGGGVTKYEQMSIVKMVTLTVS